MIQMKRDVYKIMEMRPWGNETLGNGNNENFPVLYSLLTRFRAEEGGLGTRVAQPACPRVWLNRVAPLQ